MLKIFFIIFILWIIYQINKFISGIQITKAKNQKKGKIDPKSRIDIQDEEYEEVELRRLELMNMVDWISLFMMIFRNPTAHQTKLK